MSWNCFRVKEQPYVDSCLSCCFSVTRAAGAHDCNNHLVHGSIRGQRSFMVTYWLATGKSHGCGFLCMYIWRISEKKIRKGWRQTRSLPHHSTVLYMCIHKDVRPVFIGSILVSLFGIGSILVSMDSSDFHPLCCGIVVCGNWSAGVLQDFGGETFISNTNGGYESLTCSAVLLVSSQKAHGMPWKI